MKCVCDVRLAVVAGCVAMLANAAGCSRSPYEAPESGEDFADVYAHAVCDGAASCCERELGRVPAKDLCLEWFDLVASVATAQGPFYDRRAAQDCLDLQRMWVKSCGVTNAFVGRVQHVCERVFTGGKRPGEQCRQSVDCGYSPRGRTSCNGEICVLYPEVGIGNACGPCKSDDAMDCGSCEANVSCTFNVCLGPSGPGGSCAGRQCVPEAFCNQIPSLSEPVCQPRKPVGAACGQSGVLENDCGPAALCSFDRVCVRVGRPGESCGVDGICEDSVCIDGTCHAFLPSSCTLPL
jgi:hypothetical protein